MRLTFQGVLQSKEYIFYDVNSNNNIFIIIIIIIIIFITIYIIENVLMTLYIFQNTITQLNADFDDITFSWMKLHTPALPPGGLLVEVLLEVLSILQGGHCVVAESIIHKKAGR